MSKGLTTKRILHRKLFAILLFIYIIGLFNSCNQLNEPITVENFGGFCLTFDDTFAKEWESIIGLLDSNNVKATFFVTRINRFSQSEIEALQNLYNAGNEIGCHTLNHANALTYFPRRTLKEYLDKEIKPVLDQLKIIDIVPTSFAFPNGYTNDSLNTELLKYFKVLRIISEEQRKGYVAKVNVLNDIYYKFDNSRILSALGIDHNFKIDIELIKEGFERAKMNNEVIIFYAHRPVNVVWADYQIEKKFLRDIIHLAKEMGLKNYKFSDLVNADISLKTLN